MYKYVCVDNYVNSQEHDYLEQQHLIQIYHEASRH